MKAVLRSEVPVDHNVGCLITLNKKKGEKAMGGGFLFFLVLLQWSFFFHFRGLKLVYFFSSAVSSSTPISHSIPILGVALTLSNARPLVCPFSPSRLALGMCLIESVCLERGCWQTEAPSASLSSSIPSIIRKNRSITHLLRSRHRSFLELLFVKVRIQISARTLCEFETRRLLKNRTMINPKTLTLFMLLLRWAKIGQLRQLFIGGH